MRLKVSFSVSVIPTYYSDAKAINSLDFFHYWTIWNSISTSYITTCNRSYPRYLVALALLVSTSNIQQSFSAHGLTT